MSRRWVALWLTLTPLALQADNAPADVDPQNTGVQAQIDALNKRLERLEQTLQSLRSRLPPPDSDAVDVTADRPPPAPVAPGLAAYQELDELRANWKRLRRGLSRTELRELLGAPRSELALGRQTLWYYRYPGIGGGSVMLGSSGKVTGWQDPPFRGW